MKDTVLTYRKYIGRSYETYDCFALVKEFYLDHFNLNLVPYYEAHGTEPLSRLDVQSLIVSNKGDFVRVDEPQFGDIVVIRLYGLECHIGVCLNKSQFLHSAHKIGSLMDRLERYSKMISGYYRHREKQ